MSAAVATPADPLSEEGLEMLRAAVNIARDFQCNSLASLRMRLVGAYPGREPHIEEALKFWALDVVKRHPNGVPRC